MTADLLEKGVVKDRSQAIRLAKRAIDSLDTKPLEPFVSAMLTDGHKAALSAMAVSGDEPNTLEKFLVVCKKAGLLNREDCHRFTRDFVEAKRSRAA